ncbi:ABC transporter substrate-binding protein, partial [Vibrio sp. 431]
MFIDTRRARRIAAVCWLLFTSSTAHAGSWQHEGGTLTLDEPPKRIVTLNWAATESLLLLDVAPVGVADLTGYRTWVKEPALPEGIANVGTRVAPSLEAIAELKPDLIVTSSEMALISPTQIGRYIMKGWLFLVIAIVGEV